MRREAPGSQRLEAFSDGVMAIIVTITVFGLRPPDTADLPALLQIWPKFATYAASFVFVAIVWVNHHSLVQSARVISTATLWSNIMMMFTMSFIPFATAYLSAHIRSPLPVAIYNGLFLSCLLWFSVLSASIARHRPREDEVSRQRDRQAARKNLIGMGLHLIAIPLAFVSTWTSLAIVIAVSAFFAWPARWPAAVRGGEPAPS
ncbi:TMEM175 family protein [Caulobacter sp. S45]|uniref:TMEM175 family protein n=1 Tax=Caulobacter sp. S45 TaxID=1641861 RepID=UPI00131C35D3|nr:TMEM175 family protein [Caulobacter sp. S45]